MSQCCVRFGAGLGAPAGRQKIVSGCCCQNGVCAFWGWPAGAAPQRAAAGWCVLWSFPAGAVAR